MITAEPISETVSKKRGRPRLYNREIVDLSIFATQDVTTNRQKQARWNAQCAINCFVIDGNVLDGVEELFNVKTNTVRVSVLEHLGRLKREFGLPEEEILDLARQLSREFADDPKMTVRRAVKILRVMRGDYRARRETI